MASLKIRFLVCRAGAKWDTGVWGLLGGAGSHLYDVDDAGDVSCKDVALGPQLLHVKYQIQLPQTLHPEQSSRDGVLPSGVERTHRQLLYWSLRLGSEQGPLWIMVQQPQTNTNRSM